MNWIVIAIIALLAWTYSEKENMGPLTAYWLYRFNQPQRDFITQAFQSIPEAKEGQTALVLAADLAEGDLNLPLEKGYHLIALDYQLIYNYYDFLIPNYQQYKDKIKIIIGNNILDNKEAIPSVDLVMASFIFPFHSSKENFKEVWHFLNSKIKRGGYFVGNFFDPHFTLYKINAQEELVCHTKQEVINLFKDYEIMRIEEVKIQMENAKNTHKKLEGKEHYYEVFAKKVR